MICKNPRVNKNTRISVCGRYCVDCKTYSIDCRGCYHTRENPPVSIESDMCAIYECFMKRNIMDHCGNCVDMPCNNFDKCYDPKMTNKEIEEDKSMRVELLKKLRA